MRPMFDAPGYGRALTGFFVFVLEANRVTGIFLVPVMVVCTALFFRARFHWLLAAGLVALLFYLAECSFYHHLFGDWLHDLTANTYNRAAKGTELENPWLLPFRFLDSFWQDPLARLYSLCALAGMFLAWRRREIFPRVLAIWCVLLLLEYSCTPQSLRPASSARARCAALSRQPRYSDVVAGGLGFARIETDGFSCGHFLRVFFRISNKDQPNQL